MVKILKLFILPVLILLSFSCDFIQSSPFDNAESLLLASKNLSDYLLPVVDNYKLSILDNGNKQLLFLYLERSFSVEPDQKRVIILNNSLHVLSSYDEKPSITLGSLAMATANGYYLIGNTEFNEQGKAVFNTEATGIDPNSSGFANYYDGSGNNFIFTVNNSIYPPVLECKRFGASWNLISNFNIIIGPGSNYSLVKLSNDYDRSIISFILSEDNYSVYYSTLFIRELFPDFISFPSLLDYETTVQFNDVDSDSIGYTCDGIGAGNYNGLKLISPVNGGIIYEEEGWDNDNRIYAYDLQGDHFYVFDRNDKNIYKYYTWWDEP